MSNSTAKTKALTAAIRFEAVEHDGEFYAVRASCPRITKAIARHPAEDQQSRLVEIVIQVTHEAVPVPGLEGKQATEEISVPQFRPVLGPDGKPVLEPVLDNKGRPTVANGEAVMRGKIAPELDADGNQVVKVITRPKFTLGPAMFDPSSFDSLMEQPTHDGTLLYALAQAYARVNDRDTARDLAKKS